MTTVSRTAHALSTVEDLTILEQTFRFRGDATAGLAADVLMSAPLTGADSVFGERPGQEGPRTGTSRTVRGFSPAPGFTFDVELRRADATTFVVTFTQPDRSTPYLSGDFLWSFRDTADGVELHEQINTEEALRVVDRPLTGDGPSLRRWIFFRVGHGQVMAAATRNLAALLP